MRALLVVFLCTLREVPLKAGCTILMRPVLYMADAGWIRYDKVRIRRTYHSVIQHIELRRDNLQEVLEHILLFRSLFGDNMRKRKKTAVKARTLFVVLSSGFSIPRVALNSR